MTGKRIFIFVSALALLLSTLGGAAEGIPRAERKRSAKEKLFNKEVIRPTLQHGPSTDHLPATRSNVKLISKLRLTNVPGGISDVHYFKGHAYLGGWAPQCTFTTTGTPINGGGTYVVNVRNPHRPRRVAFIDAGPNNYVTEGVHAIHMNTRFFTGDVLVISNEACDSTQPHRGGFDLYDITNPRNPVPLVLGFGDTDFQNPALGPEPNLYHSAMGWFVKAEGSAYVVGNDNEETTDVDIFDITNPRRPGMISETGLADWPDAEVNAFGDAAFHHDMWVQKNHGRWEMMVSYWDAGWVLLNVDNPANPVFVDDSNYEASDPEFPQASPPEGNAHQGEWSRNRRFFFGSDEDFSGERFETFQITSGSFAGQSRGAGVFGFTPTVSSKFPADQQVNGPVVWGGTGCVEDLDGNGTSDRQDAINNASHDDVFPGGAGLDPGEEATIVFTRGVCFFSIKIETGQMAGYDVVIIGNHHAGSQGGTIPDAFFCGSQGHEYTKTATGFCVGHKTMHDFFDDTPEYGAEPYNGSDITTNVPLGTVGAEYLGRVTFDGFGYVHMLDANTLDNIDTFAPAVVKDPANSFGKGTMSVHEVEADPRRGKRLVYVAWYSAGLRVLKYDSTGMRGAGRFIARGGNDFWGVAVQQRGRNRPLIYMSDRDSGLYIFKYTGRE